MTVTIIGAGKLAWHLAQKLYSLQNVEINQVFSRQFCKAQKLASKLNAHPCTVLKNINTNVDLIIVAVIDDAIGLVAKQIKTGNFIIAHTSGSVSIKQLENHKKTGVFYPLQSFSFSSTPNWKQIPFFIDGNDSNTAQTLSAFAKQITSKVYTANDTQRAYLHLSAVFANNFSNHIFYISHTILKNNNLPFDAIMPLIQETVNKLKTDIPLNLQTGPAIRRDMATLEKHEKMLENNKNLQSIYQIISDSILQTYHNE